MKNQTKKTDETAIAGSLLLPTVFSQSILKELHNIIDRKFNRTDRSKKVSPVLLKNKMTLWSLAEEFINESPEKLSESLRELTERGSVVSNIDEDGIYPFDAYFIPKTELINEDHFAIFSSVVKSLHCW